MVKWHYRPGLHLLIPSLSKCQGFVIVNPFDASIRVFQTLPEESGKKSPLAYGELQSFRRKFVDIHRL